MRTLTPKKRFLRVFGRGFSRALRSKLEFEPNVSIKASDRRRGDEWKKFLDLNSGLATRKKLFDLNWCLGRSKFFEPRARKRFAGIGDRSAILLTESAGPTTPQTNFAYWYYHCVKEDTSRELSQLIAVNMVGAHYGRSPEIFVRHENCCFFCRSSYLIHEDAVVRELLRTRAIIFYDNENATALVSWPTER